MNKTENRRRPSKRVGTLLILCVPTLILLLVGQYFRRRAPYDWYFINTVSFVLLGLVVSRFIFLFRSSRTPGGKIWRAVVWVILLAFLLLFCYDWLPKVYHHTAEENAQDQFETEAAEIFAYADHGIAPLELGAPKSVVLHTHIEQQVFFQSRSYTLLCSYDEQDYAREKAALDARYSFRTELMSSRYKDGELIPPYVSVGDDFFRVLRPEDGEHDCDFYQRCFLIVTNDAEREIGYIIFYDQDLDMTDDLEFFLYRECGWRFIRA